MIEFSISEQEVVEGIKVPDAVIANAAAIKNAAPNFSLDVIIVFFKHLCYT